MQNSFDKRKEELEEFSDVLEKLHMKEKDKPTIAHTIPEDLVCKCPSCDKLLINEDLIANMKVCPNCGHHYRITPKERLDNLMDEYVELFNDLEEKHLDFPDYEKKLNEAKKLTNEHEAITTVYGKINGISAYVGVMNSFFMMGSMGEIVGMKVTKLAEEALKNNRPLIIFSCSGGARMQEGIISLMQMAKTSAAIARFREKGLYISVLTDPTFGGVTASFASLADITLAEPNALIGFAGKRVIESTIKEVLPKEFQTAEFNLSKGFIDKIVPRKDLKETLSLILKLHGYDNE